MSQTINDPVGTNREKKEYPFKGLCLSGFLALFFVIIVIPGLIGLLIWSMSGKEEPSALDIIMLIVLCILFVLLCKGYIVQEPNNARVMTFFGKYVGTFRKTGFYWVNPFLSKVPISLRIRNIDVDPIKVNDKAGNPVLIGMVLVWKIDDTYRAVFDLDSVAGGKSASFERFVRIQSDAALREVASKYTYDSDHNDDRELTLRGGGKEINELLEHKINERVSMAGIDVVEARINYLAYAPEIAAVMLRRQQANAIISAREKIVEGAVSMVKMALDQIETDKIATFDETRKAALVGNLLMVLCSDEPAQPVINADA